jgi:hypothetical protein
VGSLEETRAWRGEPKGKGRREEEKKVEKGNKRKREAAGLKVDSL